MTEETASVELTLDESGMLYHMLLQHLMDQDTSKTVSVLFTDHVIELMRRREIILLRKLGAANDELRQ